MKKEIITPTILYEEAARRMQELQKAKNEIIKRIDKYPEGIIHICKSNGNLQYRLRNRTGEKADEYLKFTDKRINIYLQKKNDEESLKLINKELANIKHFLEKSGDPITKLQSIYSQKPTDVKKRVIPIDVNDEDYVEMWLSQPYIKKEIKSENQIYRSEKGDIVRSKSELNIANTLFKYHIPYKYECPFTFRTGRRVYPDFTVLQVKKRREVYWEHRGMMDDAEYLKGTIPKMKEYMNEGIFLGDRLIISEESLRSPLSTNEIEAIVKHYFL